MTIIAGLPDRPRRGGRGEERPHHGYAADYGRDVAAVPGPIMTEGCAGTNALLKDGAILVRDVEDLLAELSEPALLRVATRSGLKTPAPPPELDADAAAVLTALDPSEARDTDALVAATGLSAARLSSALVRLELDGLATALPGALSPLLSAGLTAASVRFMGKSLVIVESPAKADTLAKFLGKEFTVRACYGHVRDLPRKGISVDRANGYEPSYEVLPGKEKVLAELKRAGKGAGTVFLAADPDREGEAICWHLREELRPALRGVEFKRAEFQEITRSAVTRAVERPGTIDMNRVNAQQARRIIDRLVGYEVSDLLWSKVWRGLSAGRVQTVALRIIVERETERGAVRRRPLLLRAVHPSEGRCHVPGPRRPLGRGEAEVRRDGPTPRDPRGGGHRGGPRPFFGPPHPHGRGEGATLHTAASVHDVEAPAGGRARPRLHGPADDAGRPAPLRGQGARRAGDRRPHHLHADRLDADGRRGARGGP
jgi:hypothetical protein